MNDDAILDALPLHLRNKVLGAVEVDEEGNVTRVAYREKVREEPQKVRIPVVLLCLSYLWGLLCSGIGLLFFATLVFAPIGVFFWILGSVPVCCILIGREANKLPVLKKEKIS